MAYTKVSDIIVPSVFNPYVTQLTTRMDSFVQSGIVQNDAELDTLANSGGILLNMPYFNDLTGDSQVLSDSTPLTVNNITAGTDVARLQMRGNSWGVNDLAKALSGDDPMAAIASRVAKFWIGERSKILFNSLKGIETTLASTNVSDISGLAGASAIIGVPAVLNAKQLLGDNAEKITAMAMHSAVYTKLQKNQEIDYIPDAATQVNIPIYLGKYRVIVDDQCPYDSGTGVYTTYLFGEGAFGLGNGAAPVPTETDRDTLQGTDILINRQHFLLHPRGIKWNNTTVAGQSPTFAELATAGNWTRVYDSRNLRIVIFKHKIA